MPIYLRIVVSCASLLLPCIASNAQTPVGDCRKGVASALLESQALQATFYNRGNLFYARERDGHRSYGGEAQYIVPAGSGKSPIYSATFLLGGMVKGELRTAATTYVDFQFWPGPLDDGGHPPENCAAYDRIYHIDRKDLAEASCPLEPGSDFASWPAELGAPVVDGDGDPHNYAVAAGDRPALFGDESVWWIMNDAGNQHGDGETPPIGMEVRASAFLFGSDVGEAPASPAAHHLRYTTMYRYELVYKGSEPLEDAYVGLYMDGEIGFAGDDATGTDTTLDLVYTYNIAERDPVFGAAPPATGIAVLRGPDGENGRPLGLEASALIWKGFNYPFSEPFGDPEAFYHNLQGLSLNGDSIHVGGMGVDSVGNATSFQFPGDPVDSTYWSGTNIDGQRSVILGGDRRVMASSGPFDMEPGDVEVFEFAIVTAFGKDNLDSISELRDVTRLVRATYADIYEPTIVQPSGSCPIPPDQPEMAYFRNHPDPARGTTTFEYTLSVPARVLLRVFDALGRQVAVVIDDRQDAGPHSVSIDVSGLSAGLYFTRFELLEIDAARPIAVTDPLVIVR